MCTAVSFHSARHYFGRNLDLECSLGESVVIMPRRYPLDFRRTGQIVRHHALIGMAFVVQDTPLFYDAVNECGLAAAGLNFPGNAVYGKGKAGKDHLPSYALIPWLLSQCATVAQARLLLQRLQLTDEAFSPDYPPTPLHWMLSDRTESVVIEQTVHGLQIHDNPVGVLTNNPPFPWHMTHLNTFLSLTAQEPENRFDSDLPLERFSRGMGAIGLPGDYSSPSRFVRAAFALHHAPHSENEEACVNQFFHLLSAVSMPKGCVVLTDGRPEYTVYSSCCSTERGVYYYTTYENSRITAVDMHRENLDSDRLVLYPMRLEADVFFQNSGHSS